MRRVVLRVSLALMLGTPAFAATSTPASGEPHAASRGGLPGVHGSEAAGLRLPDEAAMVLAGTLLLGAAAAVRRVA